MNQLMINLNKEQVRSKKIKIEYEEKNLIFNNLHKINSTQSISTESSFDEFHISENYINKIIIEYVNETLSLNDLEENFCEFLIDFKKLPKKPIEPESYECCGGGCSPCIWDIFNRNLEKHERGVEKLTEKIFNKLNF